MSAAKTKSPATNSGSGDKATTEGQAPDLTCTKNVAP